MDRETFDQHLMDYLFDELDEVTRAAMKRKLAADAECRELEARLRATLDVARVATEEPSAELEERILEAAVAAERGEPWHRKLLRSLSWAGSHAMRPQLAMAALLVLVLGSSVLLLRAKPGAMRASSAEGMPGKDPAATKPVAASAPSALSEPHAAADERKAASRDDPMMSGPSEKTLAPAAESDGDGRLAASGNPSDEDALDEAFERGMKNFRAGNHAEAQRDFAAVGGSHNKGAASALLYHARSVRAAAGCKEAVTHYGKVVQRFGNAGIGADATFEQADCYQQLGDRGRARQLLLALAENPEYQARASAELNRGGEAASTGGNAVLAPRKAAASPPPATQERAKAAPNRFDSSY